MNARKKRVWVSGGLGLTLILALLFGLMLASQIAAKPAADVQPSDVQAPLLAGGVAHSATVEVAQTYVTAWDYVNIHIKNVVTDVEVLTIVPMFSNETGVACSGVSDWYTATDYQIVPSARVLTTDTLELVNLSKTYAFTITGPNQTARSIPVTGRCFQIKLSLDEGEIYTPTYWIRLYNWDN
jgi:hypothetical protein